MSARPISLPVMLDPDALDVGKTGASAAPVCACTWLTSRGAPLGTSVMTVAFLSLTSSPKRVETPFTDALVVDGGVASATCLGVTGFAMVLELSAASLVPEDRLADWLTSPDAEGAWVVFTLLLMSVETLRFSVGLLVVKAKPASLKGTPKVDSPGCSCCGKTTSEESVPIVDTGAPEAGGKKDVVLLSSEFRPLLVVVVTTLSLCAGVVPMAEVPEVEPLTDKVV